MRVIPSGVALTLAIGGAMFAVLPVAPSPAASCAGTFVVGGTPNGIGGSHDNPNQIGQFTSSFAKGTGLGALQPSIAQEHGDLSTCVPPF